MGVFMQFLLILFFANIKTMLLPMPRKVSSRTVYKTDREIRQLLYSEYEWQILQERKPAWIRRRDGQLMVSPRITSMKEWIEWTNSADLSAKGLPVFSNDTTPSDKLDYLRNSDQTTEVPSNQRVSSRTVANPGRSVTFDVQNDCSHCTGRILIPSTMHPNGSDVFLHDVFDTQTDNELGSHRETYPGPVTGCHFEGKNFQVLICSGHVVTSVPPMPSDPLLFFQMNRTSISVLPDNAFNGVGIQRLKLHSNNITSIAREAFNGTENLMYLYLDANELTALEFEVFESLPNLVVLSLSENRISALTQGLQPGDNNEDDFSKKYPSLVYLLLRGNPLGGINQYLFWPLKDSPLEELNLQSCELMYIHPEAFDYLPNLLHVDFFNNPGLFTVASNVSLSPPRSLMLNQIGLGLLQLQSVPKNFLAVYNETLSCINLGENSFFRLGVNSFPILRALTTLNLEGCGIFTIDEGTFDGMPNLQYLYLGRNKFHETPIAAILPSLNLLSLRQNPDHLFFIDHFTLRNAGYKNLSNLAWLDLDYTNLGSLRDSSFTGLTNLQFLSMRQSKVTDVECGVFSQLKNLRILDMGENPGINFTCKEAFRGLGQLNLLFLDRCELETPMPIPTHGSLFSLRELYLGHNEIDVLSPELASGVPRLRILDIHYNKISVLPADTLANMTSLEYIDLSNNRIGFLPPDTYEHMSNLKNLTELDLTENNFVCHCQLSDLQRLERLSYLHISQWEDPQAYMCVDGDSQHYYEIQTSNATTLGCPINPPVSLAVIVAISVSVTVILLIAATCYYKRWYVRYLWFLFRLQVHRFKDSELQDGYEYDAFISFSEHDRAWVYNFLVPRLETQRDPSQFNTNSIKNSKRRLIETSNPSLIYLNKAGESDLSFFQVKNPEKGTMKASKKKNRHKLNSTSEDVPHVTFMHNRPTTFRLCLHDRDFVVGQRITENIIDNISKSRKVILIITRAYLASKWCQYEMHLAQHRLLEEHRNALILVLLEDIPPELQNKNLRYLIKTRTYLAWHVDLEGQSLFWKRLTHVLQRPDPPTLTRLT